MTSAVSFALAPTVNLRSSSWTSPSTLPSMCRSSLPVISPFTCRLAPRRAVPLALAEPVVGYVSSGAIVFASPKEDPAGVVVDAGAVGGATVCLGCCGSGVLEGVSGFLSPHMYRCLLVPECAELSAKFVDWGYQCIPAIRPCQTQNETFVSVSSPPKRTGERESGEWRVQWPGTTQHSTSLTNRHE